MSILRPKNSGHELAQIALFQRLAPAELDRLGTIASKETFRANTVVFFEGDTSDSLYGILEGSAKVFRTSDDGRDRILDILGPGEVFGEYSLIDGQPRSASVATLEESTFLSISHRSFVRFVGEAPEVLWKVLESFTDRMRSQAHEMMEFWRQDVPSRLVSVIVKLAEKHGRNSEEGRTIALALSAEALAEMVASTPDRVARLLNHLQSEGLILIGRSELTVLDMKSLRRSPEYMKEPAW